ncbi:MAG: hypothetical protein R2697_03530 [Ilumatobacteraceae bacterium]
MDEHEAAPRVDGEFVQPQVVELGAVAEEGGSGSGAPSSPYVQAWYGQRNAAPTLPQVLAERSTSSAPRWRHV